ncbi:disease resistance protein RPP5-like [Eucalyptus grandis]|uniref:disease resistance protein RPP5-like n=1 Tax=Eucalyptus grandis TaxID=71139 RepID=UPI00192ED76C|nr:disease resistance protein RPP5-like [Eucalyptus grandis]
MSTVPLLTCCFRGSTRSRASCDKDTAAEPSQEVVGPFSSDLLVDSAEGGSYQGIDGLRDKDQTQTSHVTGWTQFGDQSLHRPAGMKREEEGEETAGALTSNSCGYEVFLSFRGPDTRLTIADCLYEAMIRAGIRAFKDDPELQVGEEIGGSLLQVINNSRIYIPIFSKNYASSKWCLRELAHMVECIGKRTREADEKVILPIFYDVDVDDVKLKTELYRKALQKHKSNSRKDLTRKWEEALGEVAKIKGWNLKDHGEDKLVKLVVEKVTSSLWTKLTDVPNDLVGIKDRMDDIMKKLDLGVSDVRFIVIHGMGGIGKTTLAEAVFEQISPQFQGHCCFLKDVRSHDIVILQKKLLSDILNLSCTNLSFIDQGTNMIKKRFKDKKVLIILDDIDKPDQIRGLVGHAHWFGEGSRIIIMTRNIDFLVTESEDDNASHYQNFSFYDMPEMNRDDALQLFCERALGLAKPPSDYVNISNELINALGRLPLALNVIGSTLRGKSRITWEEFLQRIKKIINDDKLWMHDQLRDLGRDIVHSENSSSDQRGSRLWCPKDAFHAVKRKKGIENIVALNLGTPKPCATYRFKRQEFVRLVNLRFLQLDHGNFEGDFKDLFFELRWLSWSNCPSEFQATNFGLENLVVLKLSGVNITKDWGGWLLLMLPKLPKSLTKLSFSLTSVTPIPDLSNLTNLVDLEMWGTPVYKPNLEWLVRLRALRTLLLVVKDMALPPMDLSSLSQLQDLNLTYVEPQSLTRLPSSLQSLSLWDAQSPIDWSLFSNLENLSTLSLTGYRLEEIRFDVLGKLRKFNEFRLEQCPWIKTLPVLPCLKEIRRMSFTFNRQLTEIEGLGELKSLRELYFCGCTSIRSLSETDLSRLQSLNSLKFCECESLESLPNLPYMKTSFHLTIEKCPRLHDYDGPYRSYRDGEIL